MINIAVIISGTGRNLQNLIRYSKMNKTFNVCFVGANRECPGLKFAHDHSITIYVDKSIGDYICDMLYRYNIDIICLAGFLKKVYIPAHWNKRVLNIHPAPLPEFGGKGMYGIKVHQEVIKSGSKYSGCVVHFCDNEYDHGEIILEKMIEIQKEWTADDLAKAVFELEKEAYPSAIESLLKPCE